MTALMKKRSLTFAIVCASNVLSYAGPAGFSGKEMKQVAPAPAPSCFNWTGFYTGVVGGYKFSNVDVDLNLGGFWNGFPGAKPLVESRGSQDLDNDGAELGGLIGYNYQWNCWVLGVEADGGYLWARESNDTGVFLTPDTLDKRVHSSFKAHYLMTFAPRFGYAFGRYLPYVTGGLAVGDLDFFQEIRTPQTGFHQTARTTDTNAGWMVGGGLQYALTEHWSVRAQYQYIDLGDVAFDSHGTPPFQTAIGHHEAELTEHNASFAIMFKF